MTSNGQKLNTAADMSAFVEVVRAHTAQMTAPRCFVLTFGCQQNVADSEKLSGMAVEMGYTITDKPEDATLILVNTCAIREHAEIKALSIVGQYKHLREKNPDLVIGVCGCMVAQEHRREQLKRSYPYVSFILGTSVLHRLPERLGWVVHSHLVNIYPIHEHIVGGIFDQTVPANVRGKPSQKHIESIAAFSKHIKIAADHINVIEHPHPYKTIGGMEHSSVIVAQKLCGALNIKFGKAHIPK